MVVARLGKFSVFAGIAGTHTFMCHFMIAAAIPTLRTTAHDLVLCLQCWSHVLGSLLHESQIIQMHFSLRSQTLSCISMSGWYVGLPTNLRAAGGHDAIWCVVLISLRHPPPQYPSHLRLNTADEDELSHSRRNEAH